MNDTAAKKMNFTNAVICDKWLKLTIIVSAAVFTNVCTAVTFQVTGSIIMDNITDLSLVSHGDIISFTFNVKIQTTSESERYLISIAGDSLEFYNQTQVDDVSWSLKDEDRGLTYKKDSLVLDVQESLYTPLNRQNTHLAYLLNISGSLDQGAWILSGTFRMFVVAEVTSGSLIRGVITITILETSHETSTKTKESNYYVMPMADVNVEATSSMTQPILGLFTAQIKIDSARDVNDCGINVYTSPEETSKEVRLTVQTLAVAVNDTKGTSLYTRTLLKDWAGFKLSTLGSYQKNMGVMSLPNIDLDQINFSHLTVASNFVVRVEDYSQMKSGDKWPVLVGVSFSDNIIWVGEISVNISAPKVSLPDLVVDLRQLQECAYDGNTTAVLEVLVKHSANSTGTAYNVTVNVYLPDYMAMRQNDFTVPLENTITVRQESSIIVTQIGRLTFSDPFTLEVTLDVNLSSLQVLESNNRVVTVEAIWGDRWGNLTDLLSDAVYLSVDVSTTCWFEELMYLPKSAATDPIRCDAFHMRRGSATGVSCHKILSTSPPMYLELSPRVSVVTGFNPSTGHLYGISNNGLAYLVSKDAGASWTSIRDNIYANVTSDPLFIRANITQAR